MRSRNIFAFGCLALLALALVAAGCGGSTTTTGAATTATTSGPATTATTAGPTTTAPAAVVSVKIGAAGPFTGQLSKIGLDALNAVKMAVEEFNAAQAKIKVTVEVGDDAADPAKAANVAEKFSADTALVSVVGPMTSAAVKASLPIFEKNGLGMLTQSATNDDLSKSGFKVFHRICPVDAAQGAAVAGIIGADLKATKVYIIDDKGTYGQGLADQVEKTLKEKYGFTADRIGRAQITAEDKDFSAIITKIKAFAPDAFFASLPSPAQYAAIAKQMVQMGYKVQLVGSDSVKDQGEFLDNAGGATEGCHFASLGALLETSTDPKAVEFVKKFTAEYQVLSMFSGQSYEAANVMLDAIQRAYDANGGKVDRAGVLAALTTTNYSGVLGIPLQFQPNGDLVSSGVFIGKVEGGKFVQVKAADY